MTGLQSTLSTVDVGDDIVSEKLEFGTGAIVDDRDSTYYGTMFVSTKSLVSTIMNTKRLTVVLVKQNTMKSACFQMMR